MTENLILFTITPVQKFITTARKTEDLWLGSYILSHLNATAIQQIYDKKGIKVIYPSIGDDSPFGAWRKTDITLPSFPNLFLAMSEELSIEELTQTMQYVEAAVQCEFEKIARHAVEFFVNVVGKKKWNSTGADDIFKRQIKNFFQLYWGVSSRSDGSYQDWYAQTGSRLASVKNCRAFYQVSESGRKCSLCGDREIFHDSTTDPMSWWRQFAQRSAKYCRQGEALCTVCLTKRLATDYFGEKYKEIKQLSFPSTSEVSTANFKLQIANNETYKEFVEVINTLENDNGNQIEVTINPVPKLHEIQRSWNVDGDWLFEEAFSPQNLERYYGISKNAQIKQEKALNKGNKLRRELIKKVGFEPSRYFAVIALDGDGMGQTVSQAENPEAHTDISSKLNAYTAKVRRIVEKNYLGKLIYAGGDDVLALVNLADLCNILRDLRCGFPNLNNGENSASTASAGVCIAHCKVPLGDVLERARDMERAAKSVDGKDVLGIALLKHSGNISQTLFKWKYPGEDGTDIDMVTVGENLIGLIKAGEVSKKFMYTFRDVFTRLTDLSGDLELPGIVESELERLIRRAVNEKVRSDEKVRDRISENIENLTPLLAEKRMKFDDFMCFLEIVNFIAREGERDAAISETE
ncbi:MAG: type III-B CRISPR-associated protein Cas10/Cmr2 [Gammaproteobacteria bacterium]|nr:type III-B CRISPR-associated protein Cas10/Cmr2 [Candidatus Poribacteria bacterium]MYK42943.1 type III-B CRISPR-associated protein Cas10/Cmr2 [Gammaproteobacteria bacterium]